MVTANSTRRLKDPSIMDDSIIGKFLRTRKRTPMIPRSLFGPLLESETNALMLKLEMDIMKENKEIFEKYDLSEIADGPEKDELFPKFEVAVAEPASTSSQREDKQVEPNVKFCPKIVTERDRPPANNLFVPIEKAKPTGAVAREENLTDYWQNSKRRRSSISKEVSTDEEDTVELPQSENNVKEDKNA